MRYLCSDFTTKFVHVLLVDPDAVVIFDSSSSSQLVSVKNSKIQDLNDFNIIDEYIHTHRGVCPYTQKRSCVHIGNQANKKNHIFFKD